VAGEAKCGGVTANCTSYRQLSISPRPCILPVRLFAAQAHTAANPKTGEIISVRANVGDVEVYFADDNRWHSAIYWHEGSAAIPARRLQPGDTSHPVWVAAVGLASYLGAAIRGEEGEVYDLQTGKATRALPPR
jgi:hypothetical protein